MYESRAYDNEYSEPVVVLVVTGQHDVSRLVNLLTGGQPPVEQIGVGLKILRQVKRHNGGRAALELLRLHGGPDFTRADIWPLLEWIEPASGTNYDLSHAWLDNGGARWELHGWLDGTDGGWEPLMRLAGAEHVSILSRSSGLISEVIAQYGPLRPARASAEQKAGA